MDKKTFYLVDYIYEDRLCCNNVYEEDHDCAIDWRESVENPDEMEESLCAEFNAVPVIKVVLEPGDVLYCPPKWFHEVFANTVSISMSLFFEWLYE